MKLEKILDCEFKTRTTLLLVLQTMGILENAPWHIVLSRYSQKGVVNMLFTALLVSKSFGVAFLHGLWKQEYHISQHLQPLLMCYGAKLSCKHEKLVLTSESYVDEQTNTITRTYKFCFPESPEKNDSYAQKIERSGVLNLVLRKMRCLRPTNPYYEHVAIKLSKDVAITKHIDDVDSPDQWLWTWFFKAGGSLPVPRFTYAWCLGNLNAPRMLHDVQKGRVNALDKSTYLFFMHNFECLSTADASMFLVTEKGRFFLAMHVCLL